MKRPPPTPLPEDFLSRLGRLLDRVIPARLRVVGGLTALALFLAVTSIFPLVLILLGALQISGNVVEPRPVLPVVELSLRQRTAPGRGELPPGWRLDILRETVEEEDGKQKLPVLRVQRPEELGDPPSAWAIPGVFELHKVEALEFLIRGDPLLERLPMRVGFRDAEEKEYYLSDPDFRAQPALDGWVRVTIPLDRSSLAEAIDYRDVRRFLVQPIPQSIEVALIRLRMRQWGLANFVDILGARKGELTWSSIIETLKKGGFLRYTLNSTYVAAMATIGNCLFCTMVAFVLARRRFRGKNLLWLSVLAMLIIPIHTFLVPLFLIMQHVPLFGGNNLLGQGGSGWIDTYWALIMPMLVTPFGILVMRQYILSLPRDLEEAATIDGAGSFQVLRHVIFPLSRPALAVVAVTTFMMTWNDFLYPYIFTRSDEMRTLTVGLALFQDIYLTDWGHLLAGSAVAALPVILLFLLFQKSIIAALTNQTMRG